MYKNIRNTDAVYEIETMQIANFVAMNEQFQELYAFVLQYELSSIVEWRMIFNVWLFLSMEEEHLTVREQKGVHSTLSSVVFKEIPNVVPLLNFKDRAAKYPALRYIASLTIAARLLHWCKQSVQMHQSDTILNAKSRQGSTDVQIATSLFNYHTSIIEKLTNSPYMKEGLIQSVQSGVKEAESTFQYLYAQQEFSSSTELTDSRFYK